MSKEKALTEEIKLPDAVSYELVALAEDQQNPDYRMGTTGIKVDGITIRLDGLGIDDPSNPVLDIQYKLIDGIPENIQDFENKVARVVIDLVNEYAMEPEETEK